MTPASPTAESRAPGGLLRLFRPDPPIPLRFADPAACARAYGKMQVRVLVWSIVGYATFYFVRKNFSVAMPVMSARLGLGKEELGLILSLHGVVYGVSKFANGFLGDRASARIFLAAGLVLSAAANFIFGISSALIVLAIVWALNGWFQGMGFPPCARLMTHWFPPKQLATRMSIWNTSHSIGAGLVVVLCGYLAGVNWRLCFLAPAALAMIVGLLLPAVLPDTPASVGLPEVEGTESADDGRPTDDVTEITQSDDSFRSFVLRHVFGSFWIWILGLANFFVYTLRYAMLDWGPTLLGESKHIRLSQAGWMVAAFELSGVVGMLCAGWITDRVFGGRGARTCLFSMLGCTAAVLLLRSANSAGSCTLILCAAGFFIYGPQALVGITAANLATKRAAATAVGFTGVFGYASTVLSGWGLGALVQRYGWDRGFHAMAVVAIAGVALFALAWPAKPHGYATRPERT